MIRTLSLFVVVISLAGCQSRLNENRKVELEPGGISTLTIDGPSKEQKVSVEFASSEGPINVYVCLKKDEKAAESEVNSGEPGTGVLGRQVKAQNGTVEVTIPAKETFLVFLTPASGKKTTVTVKIAGK